MAVMPELRIAVVNVDKVEESVEASMKTLRRDSLICVVCCLLTTLLVSVVLLAAASGWFAK